jgi:hypothetical protein
LRNLIILPKPIPYENRRLNDLEIQQVSVPAWYRIPWAIPAGINRENYRSKEGLRIAHGVCRILVSWGLMG